MEVLLREPPHRANGRGRDTEGDASMPRDPIVCAFCQTEFVPDKYATRRTRFCSPKCSDRYRRNHGDRRPGSPGRAKLNDYTREYGNARKEERYERVRRWKKENRERFELSQRKYQLKSKFGISLEDYEALLAKQDGKCAICEDSDTSPWKYFCVDHCHKTGRVRGLLCHACNVCIGQANDDPDLLRRAIAYLER